MVLFDFLAPHGDAFEALEFANQLLDMCAQLIELPEIEFSTHLGVWPVGDNCRNAALTGGRAASATPTTAKRDVKQVHSVFSRPSVE
jgi:hypothetical protein